MGRGEYDKERERDKPRQSRSKSRSRSNSYKRKRLSESPKKDRDYDRRRNESSRDNNNERYYRRSRSPRMKYKKKTSRDNSAENVGNTLYISNLSRRIKDDEIADKFSKFGKIKDINIVRDPFTKESRGFGFVTFESVKDAESSIEETNKSEIDGKQINVEISKRNRPHHSTPGIYLGPMNTSTLTRRSYRNYSPKRRYKSRSRSRSRSYNKDKYYKRQRSRSRSGSYGRRK